MDNKTAQELVAAVMLCSRELHRLIPILKNNIDQNEYEIFAKAITTISAEMLTEILNPIFLQHPDLAPSDMVVPKLRSSSKED